MAKSDVAARKREDHSAALLDQLGTVADEIAATDAKLRELWTQRTKLYRDGVELGVSKAAMARAAGCTPEAVIHALKRSD